MATREIKPGQIISLLALAAAAVSDAFALKNSQNGQFPRLLEAQIVPGAGNTGFSVTLEHTNDPTATVGWQTVATITTGAPVQVNCAGGWYRVTIGTATGGPVNVYLVCS